MKIIKVEWCENFIKSIAIDNIEAPEGYTAEDYIRDCEANADQEWIELLESGRVSLEEVE